MKVYTYSQARQELASLLDRATREGRVQIKRRDGQFFTVQPVQRSRSPLDVPAVSTDVSTKAIVRLVRRERERVKPSVTTVHRRRAKTR